MMLKKTILLSALLALTGVSMKAQQSDFSFKLYGRIRGDLFYNSRDNVETVDGLFYMYPKDRVEDADGRDLNATAQGNLYMLYTRLGVDIKGPRIGKATTSAKIEADFRGSGTTFGVVRLRHAYVQLAWSHSAVLIGQTWHPLFGDVSPSVLNLSTGAPFQPFNRSPMIRYRYTTPGGVTLTAAAVYQSQYNSPGPDGKTSRYLKDGCIPELYASIDYRSGSWLLGAGADFLSLRPRKQSVVDGLTYKVDERVSGLTLEAHASYKTHDWIIQGKTLLASNLAHCSMVGGYGVTKVDSRTGEMSYAPSRHSMTWLNVIYQRHRWQPGIFVGYLKNLGTGKQMTGTTWGTGMDVDRVLEVSPQISYNIGHWKIGMELTPCLAWYGSMDKADGRIIGTHSVLNQRVLGVAMYNF